ncbi:MAG TPA: hypothetical protein VHA78_00295 [Candidatus Peribacteraceae bacterium]|nr:hypothetical protein [Candidatus Peribacteraceae bacterium]
MSVLDYFDGDFKNWSVDLAGARAQFPEHAEHPASETVSDLQALQRTYFRTLLETDPVRFGKMSGIVDTIIRARGEYASVLSLDPRHIMNDDEIQAMLISRDPHAESRSSLIAHTAKAMVHAGLSYDLFLQLKNDPDRRSTYLEVVGHSIREYREKHMTGDNSEWPEKVADIVAANITHGIMQKMQKMRIKQIRRAKSA